MGHFRDAGRHLALRAEGVGAAFRWKRLLHDGTYASVSDIAQAEKLDRTYVGDVLRLKLLAPAIVEARQGEWGRCRW